MTLLTTPPNRDRTAASRARWRMPWVTAGITLVAAIGALVVLYPSTASWFSQYNQSQIVVSLGDDVGDEEAHTLHDALHVAASYNEALVSGGLQNATGYGATIDPAHNVPTSERVAPGGFIYEELLRANDDGVMARLRIPSIKVDLPIYHGTAERTLLKGVGHLEGTSLPVGGPSQHSVLTAHRGLPEAVLFNDLDQMRVGDTFTIEVFGEVLTYQVFETQTVLPDESQSLLPEYGLDLVTLVTCTPLGINTHRYLVTAERILPTPVRDIEVAGERPSIPGFPWWAVILGGIVVSYGTVVWVAGRNESANRVRDTVGEDPL